MASGISVSVSEQQRQSAILKACVRSDLQQHREKDPSSFPHRFYSDVQHF